MAEEVASSPAPESSAPPPEAPAGDIGGAPQTAPPDLSRLAPQTGSAGDEVKASTLKPIPPASGAARERNSDGSFKAKDAKGDLKSADLGFKARGSRSNDPDRSFPGAQKAPDAPVPAKPGEKAPAAPGIAPAEPKAKFTFAGVEFDSPEAAENSFKTLRGIHKKLESERESEASKAHGWYQHAQNLQAEIAHLKSGSPAASSASPATAAPAAKAQGPLDGLDMGVYAQLVQQDIANGTMLAPAWLASEVATAQEKSIMSRVEGMIQPFREAKERSEQMNARMSSIDSTYQAAISQKNEAGAPIYPELADPEAQGAIGEMMGILLNAGLKEEHALGPLGVEIATLMYRNAVSRYGSASASPNAPSPSANSAAEAVTAALMSQAPSQDPVSGPSSRTANPGAPMTREDQVKSEMRIARMVDPELGFVRRSAAI